MATVYEELHALIDQLTEHEAARLLEQMQTQGSKPNVELLDWLERAEEFQNELIAKYGDKNFDTVSLLEEIHEERLNDIMGGQ